MIIKTISKTGSIGSCFFSMDIGSSKRLAMQDIQFYFACIVRCIGLCHYYQGEHNNSEKREKTKD